MQDLRSLWIRFLCCAWAALVASPAASTEQEDFGIRVAGGGSFCTGDETTADVFLDLNLTGSNETPVRGFVLAVCHTAYQLEILRAVPGADLDPASGVDPDFQRITVTSRGVIQAVIVELAGDRGIPPANGVHALSVDYRVDDAADPAPIWPCDRTLSNPPVVLSFSTGDRSYYPLPDNLEGVEITSECVPEGRSFRLGAGVSGPLKVRCGTGAGSMFLDVLLSEDPVECCPARLLRGVTIAIAVPEDLQILRYHAGDDPVLKITPREGDGCTLVDVVFMPSARFGEQRAALRVELGARPEFWEDGFDPAERIIEVLVAPPGETVGAAYVDGRIAPFADGEDVGARIAVVPHCPSFRRGDSNADGDVDIADAIMLLSWMYARGDVPPCVDAADSNDDGAVDIGDPITILTHLYGGGNPFPEPFESCGRDATDDGLDCDEFPPCDA